MSDNTVYSEPTYGNWRKPRTAGIGRFGALETGLLIGGLLLVVIIFRFGGALAGGITLVALVMLFSVATVRDKHGRSAAQRIAGRSLFRRGVRGRRNIYRSGPVGLIPTGTYQLPGLLAKSTLHEFEDSFERKFAMLHIPSQDHVTVVISVEPTGLALDDRQNIDAYVANWGGWLAGLSKNNDVVAASVTVETAPDYGVRLRHEIDLNMHKSASAAAKEMMGEIKATFPQTSAVTRAWVSITFSTWRAGANHVRKPADVGIDLAARMGKFTEHLEVCGAGDARPVSAQELCEIVRVAYDPAIAEHIDAAHIQGEVPPLSWDEVGPVAHTSGWEWYRHDSGLSKSWTMSGAPRGVVFANVLENLLSPSADVNRKRVTLLYRPVSAAMAMNVAEKDVNQASSRSNSTRRPSFQAAGELAASIQTAKEIADDAGMINFGVVITATVLNEESAVAATYEIEDLGSAAQLMLRPAYGSQAATFAAGLPLGLVLPDHVAVPARIREAM